MANENKEIILSKTPETPIMSNPTYPIEDLTESIQVKKITGESEVENLETIIKNLKTSITQLERLVDG